MRPPRPPAPRLEPEAAQDADGPPVVLTQVISKPYTTFTAIVTLGPGNPPTKPPPPATTTPDPGATATAGAGAESSTPVAGSVGGSGSSLSGAQIGALLGSILGFVVLAIAAWYCVGWRRQRRWDTDSDDDGGSSDGQGGSQEHMAQYWTYSDGQYTRAPPPVRRVVVN